MAVSTGSYEFAALRKILESNTASAHHIPRQLPQKPLPPPSKQIRVSSLTESPFDLQSENPLAIPPFGSSIQQPETVLYLAYGSNLAAETFQGRRGIRPLSAVNVVVPELVMTFDLAGLPYLEPCFANTKYRDAGLPAHHSGKSGFFSDRPPRYHKNRWRKGLVGVVYMVTRQDFAHIIATEGGGASYQDVLVDCYELPANEDTVPEYPTSTPFKAHTLYSPVGPPNENPPEEGGRFSRPDPDYAQASARYLKLITDGADEHSLPAEYKAYLHQIRPYTVTTQRQRLGAWIFATIWLPFISLIFGLFNRYADKDGKVPHWLAAVSGAIFKGMWANYDGVFVKIFGDGERTSSSDEAMYAGRRLSFSTVRQGPADEKSLNLVSQNV